MSDPLPQPLEYQSPQTPIDDAPLASLMAKIGWRLIPFMCLLYLLAYLDRVNVGFAASAMSRDLRLSPAVYGFGAGIFFVGYFFFEVPSNLILEKTGARRWIFRIMITWGLVSSAMIFVRGPLSFYALRLLLGVAEAGFFPGMVLYLSYWFPPAYRARTMALFFTSTAVAGVIGGPISGTLLRYASGSFHLRGWQWLFLLEGLPSVLGGIAVYLLLPDGPRQVRWLNDAERAQLSAALAPASEVSNAVARSTEGASPFHDASPRLVQLEYRTVESKSHHQNFIVAMADPRMWILCGVYFTLMIGLYGVSYWMPSVLARQLDSPSSAAWYSALPYAAAVIAMFVIGRLSDRTGERRRIVSGCCLSAAIGLAMVGSCHDLASTLIAFSLAAVGVWSAVGPFWSIPGDFLSGTAAAGGLAAINSIGNLGGFVGPSAVGYLITRTHAPFAGLYFVAVALAVGALLILMTPAPPAEA